MMYIIGSRGRLGQALMDSTATIVAPERAVYADWWQANAKADMEQFFTGAPASSVVLITAGILDPTAPEILHQHINIDLPCRIMDVVRQKGLRVVTFGTVMETLLEQQNPYITAKAMLGKLVAERASSGELVTHVQLHTLYGSGEPAPHMFLGQMYRALRDAQPFTMSSGQQLREYHHVYDVAQAVQALLCSEITGRVSLNHGQPCSLRDLAVHVFTILDHLHLLQIGARPDPACDNYATMLTRPDWLSDIHFRPALPGVAAYMQTLLSVKKILPQ